MKNSFHIKNMNVVSPLNELSGDSSGLKHTKCFSTLITLMRFLSSVDLHVTLETLFVCETLSTLSAGERFLSSVDHHMFLKV